MTRVTACTSPAHQRKGDHPPGARALGCRATANKPGVSNLLEIHAAVTGRAVPDVEREFAGSGYGAFKAAVADAVVEALRPLQEAYTKLEADPAEVDRQLALGADKARAIAEPVLARPSISVRGRAGARRRR